MAPWASKVISRGAQVSPELHVRLKLVRRSSDVAVVETAPVEHPSLTQNSPLKLYPPVTLLEDAVTSVPLPKLSTGVVNRSWLYVIGDASAPPESTNIITKPNNAQRIADCISE